MPDIQIFDLINIINSMIQVDDGKYMSYVSVSLSLSTKFVKYKVLIRYSV